MQNCLKLIFIALLVGITSIQYSLSQKPPDLSKLKTAGEKLKAWHKYSNALLGNGEYKALVPVAKKGLELCPPDSLEHIAMFNLFAGVAYENLNDYNTAITYYNTAIPAATQCKKEDLLMLGLSRLDIIYSKQNQTQKRKEVLDKMKVIGDSLQSLDVQDHAITAMAGYYSDIGQYEKSIEYRLKCIEISKLQLKKDPDGVGTRLNVGFVYNNLANLYNFTGHPEKALEYLNLGRPYIGSDVLRHGEATQYVYFVQTFLALKNMDSARVYYNKAYTDMPQGDTIYKVLSHVNREFGNYYLEKNDSVRAVYYAVQAKRYADKDGNYNAKLLTSTLLGKIYFMQKKYKLAIDELSLAVKNDFEFDKENELSIRKKLSESYAKLGEWDSAYKQLDIYTAIFDTLMIQKASKNFAEVEAKYQNKEKVQEISAQKNQLSFARKQKAGLIAGLVLLALIVGVLYKFFQDKKKSEAKLAKLNAALSEANQTKATLFGIISHDLRAPVNQVYQFLKIQEQNPGLIPDAEKAALSSKIKTAAGSLLETMEDLLLWSKTQMDQFSVHTNNISVHTIVAQAINLLKLQAEAKQIKIFNNIHTGIEVETDENYLHTIFRNLLQNAIKASPVNSVIHINSNAHKIEITNKGAAFTQAAFEAVLKDNTSSKGLSGIGLKLVNELSIKINAKIYFENPDSETTISIIELP